MDTINRIAYRIDYDKAIETLVWLANQKSGIDIYHVAKILFYADKKHLNRYARPIIGDTYICMDYGPVPSGVRDLINKNPWLSPDYLERVEKSLKIDPNPYTNINPLRPANLDFFSKTDIECLKEALEECGEKSFDELKKLTHNDKCWLDAGTTEPIDYALFVDDDNPYREEILKEMSQTSPYIQV
jgi:hypothetical protein